MRRFAAVSVLFLFTLPAIAATVTVGCPGGTPGTHPSINAALAALDNQGPHTINVSGNCNESVAIDQRERLTIQGPATITGTANFAISIRNSAPVTLRSLTVSASRAGISVQDNSMAVITGVDAQAPLGNGIEVFGAIAHLGGPNAADAVIVHDSFNGMRIEGSQVFVTGRLTAENNQSTGIAAGTVSRVVLAGGANVIRNNFNGVGVSGSAYFETSNTNVIQNNQSNGILITTQGNVSLRGGTTVEGNPRSGVAVLFNSTFRSGPNVTIRNNGSATDPFRSGISASHNSMLWIGGGTQIVNNTGRGILSDSGTSVRIDNSTISGNSEEGILLQHGSILESIGGNNVAANGTGSVKCDATTIVFGDFTGFAAFECVKKDK